MDKAAADLLAQVKEIEGIRNPEINDAYGDDEIEIDLNHGKIQRLGLVAQVGNTVKNLLDGKTIASLNLERKKVGIHVRLQDKDKRELPDLEAVKGYGPTRQSSRLVAARHSSAEVRVPRY